MKTRPRLSPFHAPDWSTRLVTLAVLLLLGFALVALSGCGSGSSETGQAAETPVKGGTLRLVGQPSTLDPALYGTADEMIVDHCIFETLFAYAPGEHVMTTTGANQEWTVQEEGLKLEPGLAADMPTVSNDGLVYTISLRDDSRFAPPVDRAVTATDVQYSFERMLREPLAWCTYFYSSIDGVDEFVAGEGDHVRGLTLVGPHTIELHLTQPDPTILHALALPGSSVVPKEWVEKWGEEFGQHPLGSGPFTFVEWPQAATVVLERNPNYHDAEHVWLDGLEFVPYSEKLADMMKVQRGELDICFLNQPDWVKVRNDPTWKQYMTEQMQVQTYYLFMNAELEPFDDVRVRQAFSWAVDRERLAKIAGCEPIWQILPEGMPGFVDGERFYGFDPAKAKELLTEAGYADGLDVTLSYPGGSDFDSKMAQALQQDLKESGIDVKLEMSPSEVYGADICTPKTISLGLTGWAMDFPDPYAWIKPLFCRDAAVKDGTNTSFWWDEEVEDMLVEAQATLDTDERRARFTEIQKVISDGAPIVPIWQMLSATLNSPETGGFYIHPVYWLDPEHYWKLEGESG
jgi:ABC-type transport system substrate-binding protein